MRVEEVFEGRGGKEGRGGRGKEGRGVERPEGGGMWAEIDFEKPEVS